MSDLRARVRRAYEWGRMKAALPRAVVVTAIVAGFGLSQFGIKSLPWLALAFTAVVFGEWRGGWFGAGARRGFALGAIALLLPMSILRPCCAGKTGMDPATCCTMPSACGLAGLVLGASVVLLWPRGVPSRKQPVVALGTLLGAAGIFAIRCEGMFWGEVLGIAGGLLGGVVASAMARALWERKLST